MDLGRKLPSEPGVSAKPESKISYPGFNLNDDVAKEYCEKYSCELGEEITATVKLRVSSLRKDEYGHSVGFDVLSMDVKGGEKKSDAGEGETPKPDATEDNSADEDAEEEKVLGYKRPKANKPKPPVTATDLEEP